jgi:SAM-dependent methyltransferase
LMNSYSTYFQNDERLAYEKDLGCRNSRKLFEDAIQSHCEWAEKILEVGPGMNRIFPDSKTCDLCGEPDYFGKFETLDIPEGSFDVIVMAHVLEHVESPQMAVFKAYKILRPHGILVVLTPAHESGVCTDRETVENHHVRCFNRDSVYGMEYASFPIIQFKYVHWFYNRWWLKIKYALKAFNYPFRLIDGKSIYSRLWYIALSALLEPWLEKHDRKYTRKPGNAFFVFRRAS